MTNLFLALGARKFRAPTEDERSCWVPPSNDMLQYGAWSREHMHVGALLPLHTVFIVFLNYVGLEPFQLHLNSYRMLAALKSLYTYMGWKSSLCHEILYLFNLKSNLNRTSKGDKFFYIAPYLLERKDFDYFPNKLPSYNHHFFFGLAECPSWTTFPSSEFVSFVIIGLGFCINILWI